jgi:hypothetical protein
MQKKYLYVHGKDNTVDVYDPKTLTSVTVLNTDGKRIIVA